MIPIRLINQNIWLKRVINERIIIDQLLFPLWSVAIAVNADLPEA